MIDGNRNGSVVKFVNGEDSTAVLSGLTVTNGLAWGGGGISCQVSSSPSLVNVTISGNTASWGGGIDCSDNSNPSLVNVTITGNSTSWGGGGGASLGPAFYSAVG